MALLHIYDASDRMIRQTAGARGAVNRLAISGGELATSLASLVTAGSRFDRILFETHGSPGAIYFGRSSYQASWFRGLAGKNYNQLAQPNARVYFNGCNVAEGPGGWDFLEAAAAAFLTPGGGEVFGQTSLGFGNPFNGHVVHLWGDTRRLFVDATGRIIERTEE